MSRTQTLEQAKLNTAEQFLGLHAKSHGDRLLLLEAAASIHSGANVFEYWQHYETMQIQSSMLDNARNLNRIIEACEIPYPMAISGLAREPLTVEEQKKNGVFYTDYRLATIMGNSCSEKLHEHVTVADLAAGTGILLAAVAQEYKNQYKTKFETWIQSSVYAFDLSEYALRGAAAAILSMTHDAHAVAKMRSNWRVCDSLFDQHVLTQKYDVVIGNPPWGKIKITRHTFMKQKGSERIYGANYSEYDKDLYVREKTQLLEYGKRIKEEYDLLGEAEPDMYMAFLQKAVSVVKAGGIVVYLIPAGLIRSKGTLPLREYLINNSSELSYILMDNKPRYFSIDSRFKFVMMSCTTLCKETVACDSFDFQIYHNSKNATERITFNVNELREQRPDLTIPEVATSEEKALFDKVYSNGRRWGETDDLWYANISREVDMTNDRIHFVSKKKKDSLPVVEGRMVQQHRFGAKKYISGSGRSAKWIPSSIGCHPQFFISQASLSAETQQRSQKIRAGYCDIAGQTNERTMMSAIIPKGVVCGNKVPTVIFPNDNTEQMIYLWVGITNSFVFDWMIRRIISTTVNYFLLLSLPMPQIDINSDVAKRIIMATQQLATMEREFYTDIAMQRLRIEIDVAVAEAYGLSESDMRLIMKDFPLLDRKQPLLSHSHNSVTVDLLFTALSDEKDAFLKRIQNHHAIGATAYVPAEMVELTKRRSG